MKILKFTFFLTFFLNLYSEKATICIVVDKSVVTHRELDERITFAIKTLNLPDTKVSREKIRDQVLNNLIDESLQLSIAKDAGLSLSKKETLQAMESVAAENGMNIQQLNKMFVSMGVNVKTLERRIKAQILWSRFTSAMFRKQVRVSFQDIEKEKMRLEKQTQEMTYNIIEIILPIDADNPQKSMQEAKSLFNQASQPGVNFALIAQQFGVSSNVGGWKNQQQIAPNVLQSLKNVSLGQVFGPIKVGSTYRIVKLVDARSPTLGRLGAQTLSLEIVTLPFSEQLANEDLRQIESLITSLKMKKTPSSFLSEAKSHGLEVEHLDRKVSDFFGPLQTELSKAKVGQVIGPVRQQDAISVMMVSGIKAFKEEKKPKDAEIRGYLEQKQLEKFGLRFFNKLRASARIKIL